MLSEYFLFTRFLVFFCAEWAVCCRCWQTCTFSSALPFWYMSCLSLSFISLNGSRVSHCTVYVAFAKWKRSTNSVFDVAKHRIHAIHNDDCKPSMAHRFHSILHSIFVRFKYEHANGKKVPHIHFPSKPGAWGWFYFHQINAIGVFLFWIISFFSCVRSTVAAKQQSVNQMEFCARLTAALLLYDSKQFDMYFRYISIQFVLADVFNEMTNSQTRCAQ